jgi:hypothetical protein
MLPLYHDPQFTFRFADDRIIPSFHLEGVESGRHVSVFKIDPGAGERLGLLAAATVGEGGWVNLPAPIIVRAGEAFIAVPGPSNPAAPGKSSATPPLTLLGVGGRFVTSRLCRYGVRASSRTESAGKSCRDGVQCCLLRTNPRLPDLGPALCAPPICAKAN